jgi:small subunit ribosomal protein S8
MVTDPISDMIIRIKNAGMAGVSRVTMPSSRLKASIADVLKKEGFVKDVEVLEKKSGRKELALDLYIEKRIPRIRGVKRQSKPSKRIYQKSADIRPVKSGYGMVVLSTPQGVMSGKEARKNKVGGEVLFTIW